MNKFFRKSVEDITVPVGTGKDTNMPVSGDISLDLDYIKMRLGDSTDLIYREIDIASHRAVLFFCDGLCNGILINDGIVKPLSLVKKLPDKNIMDFLCEKTYAGIDQTKTDNLDDIFVKLFSGFAVLMVDGAAQAVCFGVQGFAKRSIDQAYTEVQEHGAMESFVENLTDNIAMMRRKLKNPLLKIEKAEIGSTSHTKADIVYLSDRVSDETLKDVRKRLKNAKLDTVLSSGYIKPFLDTNRLSMFSAVGTTERPDTLSAKLSEGRIGVIVDGSPFALYMPMLFTEHFQSLDDYASRPYYAAFIRLLRIFCFFISFMLPGVYVAICTYHQEILSQAMLVEIAVQESTTPFTIMVEALVIHFIYEIVREAGLRMPKAVGHAVSIVGALVIGDAAVSAGIIAAPMVIIVALTAIGSFVVSTVYEPISILRFLFIIIGGISGLFGIMLALGVLIINICALNPYKVPYSSSLSPFEAGTMRDSVFRFGWKRLGKRELKINTLER